MFDPIFDYSFILKPFISIHIKISIWQNEISSIANCKWNFFERKLRVFYLFFLFPIDKVIIYSSIYQLKINHNFLNKKTKWKEKNLKSWNFNCQVNINKKAKRAYLIKINLFKLYIFRKRKKIQFKNFKYTFN